MPDTALKTQAFKLKGRLYTLTVVQLLDKDLNRVASQLADLIEKAPRLFESTPVVLDCSAMTDASFSLDAMLQCFRAHRLIPVAIHHASQTIEAEAIYLGLPILKSSSTHDRPIEIQDEKVAAEPVSTSNTPTRLITTPIRSGQQVVAKGGDLIVTSAVSHGAELLADGNIHVYGPLRGRALAGMSGDKTARIFCHSLDAELLSIAGFYRISDAITPQDAPCQIYLKDEHIHIEPI